MSNQDWKTKQIGSQSKKYLKEKKPRLEEVTRANRIPVIITDEILKKIKYLCACIPKVEWSGVLLYSVKGSIKDVDSFKCIVEDIIPMDKGSSAYTEYEFDSRVTDYIDENEQAFEWRIGHVHSHNTMDTYFSGVDMSELNDNCPNHNYYLSLIVNNYMKMTAKIAYAANVEGYKLVAEDEEGNKYEEAIKLDKQVMVIYNCDVVLPNDDIEVSDEFANAVKEILKPKKKVKFTSVPIDRRPQIINSYSSSPFWEGDYDFELDDNPLDGSQYDDTIDDFTCFLLRLGKTVTGDSVDQALDDITNDDTVRIINQIDSHYESLFDKFYYEIGTILYPEDRDGVIILSNVIGLLEQYTTVYGEIKLLIEKLNNKADEYSKE